MHCCRNDLFYSVRVNLLPQISYTEEFEHQRGKGSFPAMITPGYYLAKKAQENASDVSIHRSVGSLHLISSLIWHSYEFWCDLTFVGWKRNNMAVTAVPSAGNTDICSNAKLISLYSLNTRKTWTRWRGLHTSTAWRLRTTLLWRTPGKSTRSSVRSDFSSLLFRNQHLWMQTGTEYFNRYDVSQCVYLRAQISGILCQFPRHMKPSNVHSCHLWHACPAP